MTRNMLDKNGRPLRGSARWLREISLDGGMEQHNKKVAQEIFGEFLEAYPGVASVIVETDAKKRREKFKVV